MKHLFRIDVILEFGFWALFSRETAVQRAVTIIGGAAAILSLIILPILDVRNRGGNWEVYSNENGMTYTATAVSSQKVRWEAYTISECPTQGTTIAQSETGFFGPFLPAWEGGEGLFADGMEEIPPKSGYSHVYITTNEQSWFIMYLNGEKTFKYYERSNLIEPAYATTYVGDLYITIGKGGAFYVCEYQKGDQKGVRLILP